MTHHTSKSPLTWREAQQFVANFLLDYSFSVQQEVMLQSGGRVDIIALKKVPKTFYHFLIEVKDWGKVSRQKEYEFCQQMINYIVNYAYEMMRTTPTKGLWERKKIDLRENFIGVLCLTKDAHFSFRQLSQHFITKHPLIRDIPFREQIGEKITLFAVRFDFFHKVFESINFPLTKNAKIDDFFPPP